MPEGDTVFHAAQRLRPALVGKTLVRTDFRVPRHATADLCGRSVDSVTTYGKHLFLHLDDIAIHTHLRMDGQWRVHSPGERWRLPAHTARLILATADTEVVGFALGVLRLLRTAAVHTVTDRLGPDLLDPAWSDTDTVDAVRRLQAQPNRPVALALLDQSTLAGVGDVYRSEICYRLQINPATPVSAVPDMKALVNEAHDVLRRAAHNPPWRPLAYGRQNQPCRRCGDGIVVHLLADPDTPHRERGVYFCPKCQPP
jgi:endonuclease VIII